MFMSMLAANKFSSDIKGKLSTNETIKDLVPGYLILLISSFNIEPITISKGFRAVALLVTGWEYLTFGTCSLWFTSARIC